MFGKLFSKKKELLSSNVVVEKKSYFLKSLFSLGSQAMDRTIIEETLLEADFGGKVVLELMNILEMKRQEKKTDYDMLVTLREVLLEGIKEVEIPWTDNKINVLMLTGVNGVGKTTTVSKLVEYYKTIKQLENTDIILGAADTFRDAAIEQLQHWGEVTGVRVVSQSQGTSPSSVVYDTLESAKATGKKLVIIDTSGRLQNKVNLMEQLAKMERVLEKFEGSIAVHDFLVLDSTLGSASVSQVEEFSKKIKIDSLILTKTDSMAKSGTIYNIGRTLGIPVSFVTFGEKPWDIKAFSKNDYIVQLLGDAS